MIGECALNHELPHKTSLPDVPSTGKSLFRSEVRISEYADYYYSRPIVFPKRIFDIFLGVLAFILFFGCIALFIIPINHRVQAIGYLMPSSGLIDILAHSSGVLDAIHVREGQRVTQGQTIADIISPLMQSDTNAASVELQSLRHQLSLLEQEFSQSRQEINAEIDSILDRLSHREQEIAFYELEQLERTKLVRLTEQELTRAQQLRKSGLTSDADVEALEKALVEQRIPILELHRDIAASHRDNEELRTGLISLRAQLAGRTTDLRREEAEVRSKIAALNERRRRTVITSVTGIVEELPLNLNAAVKPEVVIAVVNAASEAQTKLTLFVEEAQSFSINVGDPVEITYESYPVHEFGTYLGSVDAISQLPISGDQVSHLILPANMLYRRLDVILNDDMVTSRSGYAPLKARQRASATIIVDRTVLWRWLLKT
ncbi:MAG: hypothetical protein GDA50_06440 [Alphaproteobacteria bacterium GM202ARS2]|nr:hypothetical protein [Alphaproteobacteria bacterium GM202ARS2]